MNVKSLFNLRWIKQIVSDSVGRQARIREYQQRYPNVLFERDCMIKGNVELGTGVSIRKNVHLAGNVSVGRGTFFNGPAELRSGTAKIEMGSFCSCASGLTIVCSNHPISKPSTYYTRAGSYADVFAVEVDEVESVRVGSDVWVGHGCTILKGVSIGHGAILGAGAVVTKDVEPYSIVGGVPACHIRHRFPQFVIEWLLRVRWWEWSDDELRQRRDFFSLELGSIQPSDFSGLEKKFDLPT